MRRRSTAILASIAACCGTATVKAHRTSTTGPPAATITPAGRPLPPDDPHRRQGARLAAPIIAGPIDDPRAPALLYIHGGGWIVTGKKALEQNRPTIRRWAREGIGVWGADYRRDRLSLPDVDAAYRVLRRRVGARRRICLLGESSGGALALLLAAKYPRIRCVVTYATVGDLRSLPTGPLRTEVADWLLPYGGYRRWDPSTNAARVSQRVILIHHQRDRTVPLAQSSRLAVRVERAEVIVLPPARSRGVVTTHGERTPRELEQHAFEHALELVAQQSTGPKTTSRTCLRLGLLGDRGDGSHLQSASPPEL